MAARKEIEKAVKFKEFQRSVDKLLTPEDQDYLFYALKEYNTYKSVGKLMLALNSCLDSAEKLDLLPYIRDLIPKHDKKRFDHLAPYNRMAHPIKLEAATGNVSFDGTDHSANKAVRVINLQRTRGSALGFSIRGGQEHELGIYISHVESLSQAEKSGLEVGDKLIRVNGIDFERVSHGSAVLVLKSHDNLKIEVKNVGKVPGQNPTHSKFVWVDAQGKPVEESDERPRRARHSIKRDERSPDRLLSSPDKHKIVLHSTKKKPLGFSIRGGSEYGLGIYISVVDPGSLSDEAGLQIGDQVLDINGHSFLSILHFEAVHILRSYTTLIMTVKSLGRVPTLKQNGSEENGITLEQSPISRRRSTEFVRTGSLPLPTRTSKRPSSATIEEEEEPEPDDVPSTSVRQGSSSLKRSESERQQRVSSTAGYDDIDYPMKLRSSSFGSGSGLNFSQRSSKNTKRQMVLSPLATHETRASTTSPSPVSSPDSGSSSPLKVKSKFFEKGLGTQVMLANVTSQAKQLLFDKARRVLSEEGVEILREDLVQYEETGNVDQFVDCLLSIFNTPEKMELLRDVRSVVKPTDIVRFDEKISPHELKTLRENFSESDSDDDFDFDNTFDTERDDSEAVMLTGVQKHNGYITPFSGDRTKSASLTFQDVAPFSLRAKKTVSTASAPELSEGQNRETKLSWHKDERSNTGQFYHSSINSNNNNNNNNNNGNSSSSNGSSTGGNDSPQLSRPSQQLSRPAHDSTPQGNPVIVDVTKEAPYIGLAIRTTADNCVLVKDVRLGGAIDREGFIKPGFEIIQVDNIRIRGKSYHNAAREIADAFKSEGLTVKFIVIPNYA